jgi:hypothetical protein
MRLPKLLTRASLPILPDGWFLAASVGRLPILPGGWFLAESGASR